MKKIAASFLLFLLIGTINAQTPTAKGTVSGRATCNGKGVKDIIVRLRPDTSGPQSLPSREAQTNQEGEYRFDTVPDGSYFIEVSSTNQYVRSQPNFGFSWKTVVIENGDSVSNIDFTLTLGGVITGTVRDAKGRPLIEAQIDLSTVHEINGATSTSSVSISNQSERQTDDRGVYRIYGVPAGRYIVSARPRQWRGEQDRVFHPATKEVAKAVLIDVTEGAELSAIDITFPTPDKGFQVTGVVIDEEGKKPVANTLVRYIKYEITGAGENQYHKYLTSADAQTDDEGRFKFKQVIAGKYAVFIDAQNLKRYAEPLHFEVIQADVQDLELMLMKGASVRGKVFIEGENGNLDLSKLKISAFVHTSPIQITNKSVLSQLNSDGSYLLEGLVQGNVNFHLFGVDQKLTLLRVEKNGVVLDKPLSIQAKDSLTDVNIFLVRGDGAVKGQIIFEGKKPAGLCFHVFADRIGRPAGNTGYNGDITEADGQGRFFFDRLPAGEYELILDPEYTFPCGAKVEARFPSVRQRIRVTDKSEQRITLTIKFDGQ